MVVVFFVIVSSTLERQQPNLLTFANHHPDLMDNIATHAHIRCLYYNYGPRGAPLSV